MPPDPGDREEQEAAENQDESGDDDAVMDDRCVEHGDEDDPNHDESDPKHADEGGPARVPRGRLRRLGRRFGLFRASHHPIVSRLASPRRVKARRQSRSFP